MVAPDEKIERSQQKAERQEKVGQRGGYFNGSQEGKSRKDHFPRQKSHKREETPGINDPLGQKVLGIKITQHGNYYDGHVCMRVPGQEEGGRDGPNQARM